MNAPSLSLKTSTLLPFMMLAVACGSKPDSKDTAAAATSETTSEAKPPSTSAAKKAPGSAAKSAAKSAPKSAAPEPPPAPPSPVDLEKKTWSEDGKSVALERTDLSKPCLLKGVSIVLPEKAKITPLMDSRGCVIRPWGETGPYLFVVNDELNFKMKPKEELKGIKRVVEETSDSWLIEDSDPKTGFAGRVTRKLGDHMFWCNGNANGAKNGEQIGRGLVKLCSTLEISSPTQPNTK